MSGVMSVSWRFHKNTSLSLYGVVASGVLYAGNVGLIPKERASVGKGRAGAGTKEGMLRSTRMGINVRGSAVWAWSCLSVLVVAGHVSQDFYPGQKRDLLMEFRFSHPVPPYSLHVNRRAQFLAQLLR